MSLLRRKLPSKRNGLIDQSGKPQAMSIKVNVRKLSPWRNDLPDEIRVEKLNEVAEDYAYEITQELGNLSCATHPDQVCYITIVADRWQTMTIEKKFCCDDFERKVSLKIQR